MFLNKCNNLLSELVLDAIRLVVKFMEATLLKFLEDINSQEGMKAYGIEGEFLLRNRELVLESLRRLMRCHLNGKSQQHI